MRWKPPVSNSSTRTAAAQGYGCESGTRRRIRPAVRGPRIDPALGRSGKVLGPWADVQRHMSGPNGVVSSKDAKSFFEGEDVIGLLGDDFVGDIAPHQGVTSAKAQTTCITRGEATISSDFPCTT